MGFLLILSSIALLAFANGITVRSLRAGRVGPTWWGAMVVAWVVGAAVGVWSGFFFEYQPFPVLRVVGAPIPAGCWHWEGPPGQEQWVDFVAPAPLLYASSNVVIVAMLTACSVGLAFWLRRRGPAKA